MKNANSPIGNNPVPPQSQTSTNLQASQGPSFTPESTDTAPEPFYVFPPSVLRKLDDMPEIYQGIYRKAMMGNSKANAIHAFCLECV